MFFQEPITRSQAWGGDENSADHSREPTAPGETWEGGGLQRMGEWSPLRDLGSL